MRRKRVPSTKQAATEQAIHAELLWAVAAALRKGGDEGARMLERLADQLAMIG